MKVLILSVIFIITFTQSYSSSVKNYDNYKVIRVSAATPTQTKALFSLFDEGKYDFWDGPTKNGQADILMSPNNKNELERFLDENFFSYTILIDSVGRLIQNEMEGRVSVDEMDWENYHNLTEIYAWIDEIESISPFVSVEVIGQSTEGRDLRVIKVSTGNSENKTAFWIDATIHAREWISTATITFILNELVMNTTEYQDILESIDFYILPLINPDGYEYTWTTDRMWRKTRSNHDSLAGCRGVDANRNFGYFFGGAGSSSNKCSDTYRGPEAYSEPEALAVKNYITSNAQNISWETYITLHSYSQLWMTPYGYSGTLPENYQELKTVGESAAAVLESYFGTVYRVGNAFDILYASSGSSRDWAKGEGGFKYVYTIELRDNGTYAFILPPDQIIDTAIETWAGIQVVARAMISI